MPLCRTPTAVDPDHITIKRQGLHNSASFGPFTWFAGITQVLYGHSISNLEWEKRPLVGTEPLLCPRVTFGMGLLPEIRLQPPFLPGLKLHVLGWEETLQLPAVYYHCWAEASEGVNGDPVFQQWTC